MFTDFSNLGQKSVPQYTRAFAANDSCCDDNKECKGYGKIQTENSAPPTGVMGTASVYTCKRDYKERECDGFAVWVGGAYDCRATPKEDEGEEDKKDDKGGGGSGGGGSGGGGDGGGDTGGEDTGGEDAVDLGDDMMVACADGSTESVSNQTFAAACTGKGGVLNEGGTGAGEPTEEQTFYCADGTIEILPAGAVSFAAPCTGRGGESTMGGTMATDFSLQPNPAYEGQSGSNAPQYPAVGVTDGLINTSGSDAWVTDYNSIGFMKDDTIRGGSYSAPSGGLVSTAQGTNPATQVGIANPLQQSIYDTFTNVTGAGNQVYMGGSPSFNESTGQYTNVTSNPIANPTTLPTTLTAWDLFGTTGASSGLFLDTPTIKQNGVATTPEVDAKVDAEVTAEPAQGGGLGLITIGLIALKALSVI